MALRTSLSPYCKPETKNGMVRKLLCNFDPESDMGYIYFRKFLDTIESNIGNTITNLEKIEETEYIDAKPYDICLDITYSGYIYGIEIFCAKDCYKWLLDEKAYSVLIETGTVFIKEFPKNILDKFSFTVDISAYKI